VQDRLAKYTHLSAFFSSRRHWRRALRSVKTIESFVNAKRSLHPNTTSPLRSHKRGKKMPDTSLIYLTKYFNFCDFLDKVSDISDSTNRRSWNDPTVDDSTRRGHRPWGGEESMPVERWILRCAQDDSVGIFWGWLLFKLGHYRTSAFLDSQRHLQYFCMSF